MTIFRVMEFDSMLCLLLYYYFCVLAYTTTVCILLSWMVVPVRISCFVCIVVAIWFPSCEYVAVKSFRDDHYSRAWISAALCRRQAKVSCDFCTLTNKHKKFLTLCVLHLGWLGGIMVEHQACDMNLGFNSLGLHHCWVKTLDTFSSITKRLILYHLCGTTFQQSRDISWQGFKSCLKSCLFECAYSQQVPLRTLFTGSYINLRFHWLIVSK